MKKERAQTLEMVNNLLYKPAGYNVQVLQQHQEGLEYESSSFVLNNGVFLYRLAKITPKKLGQFVAIWKRNSAGITSPFDDHDPFDFMCITVQKEGRLGQFIFPKKILIDKGVISAHGKGGKRGMRVYPAWDITRNQQAWKTQEWQVKFFIEILPDYQPAIHLLNTILQEG